MGPACLNNSFENVLRHQRKGKCLHELSEKIQQAVLEVRALGKPASVTLTLQISPFGDGAVSVLDEIKTKLPAANKVSSVFYSTDEGALVRQDPNQQEMKLTAVETPNTKINEAESISKSA
jgi:hypothetical protein